MNYDPIQIDHESFTVDAQIIAEHLGVEVAVLLAGLREAKITSRCERGIDDDADHFRLTFFSETRRLRLIVDARGVVVHVSTLDFGARPLPASLRKPKS